MRIATTLIVSLLMLGCEIDLNFPESAALDDLVGRWAATVELQGATVELEVQTGDGQARAGTATFGPTSWAVTCHRSLSGRDFECRHRDHEPFTEDCLTITIEIDETTVTESSMSVTLRGILAEELEGGCGDPLVEWDPPQGRVLERV